MGYFPHKQIYPNMAFPAPEPEEEKDLLAEILGDAYSKKNSKPLIEHLDDYEDLKGRDVVALSREGYCHLACEMIYAELGMGNPYVILREGQQDTYAHYFLEIHGKALDFGGVYTFEEILALFQGDGPIEPTTWPKVKKNGKEVTDIERDHLCPRFQAHILAKKNKCFSTIASHPHSPCPMSEQHESVRLPSHLLEPFFQKKDVRILIEGEPPPAGGAYQMGRLNLTVYGDGLCGLSVFLVESQLGLSQMKQIKLGAEQLDRMKWDDGQFFVLLLKRSELP